MAGTEMETSGDDGAAPTIADDVDAMERRVLGDETDAGPDDDGDAASTSDPATFAIDLEPEDQGTADAAVEDPG